MHLFHLIPSGHQHQSLVTNVRPVHLILFGAPGECEHNFRGRTQHQRLCLCSLGVLPPVPYTPQPYNRTLVQEWDVQWSCCFTMLLCMSVHIHSKRCDEAKGLLLCLLLLFYQSFNKGSDDHTGSGRVVSGRQQQQHCKGLILRDLCSSAVVSTPTMAC